MSTHNTCNSDMMVPRVEWTLLAQEIFFLESEKGTLGLINLGIKVIQKTVCEDCCYCQMQHIPELKVKINKFSQVFY